MKPRTILISLLLILAVGILGALAGWYYFLRSKTDATTTLNVGRGFGADIPFGSLPGTSQASSANTHAANAVEPPQLWHVATLPVGGLGFATSTDGIKLRYVERSTGYVFDADPKGSAIVRLTNVLMAKTYEAYIASGGRVLERSIDESGNIITYAGVIDTASSTSLI